MTFPGALVRGSVPSARLDRRAGAPGDVVVLALDLAPALERPPESELVGILEVATHR